MNKKFLICGAIAAGLLLTACVKKEAPKEDEQVEASVASENTPSEPTQFETLEPTVQAEPEPTVEIVETKRENTTVAVVNNTDTPRETTPSPAAEKPASTYTPKTNTSSAQSEDDAVADAIAAATPALDN